MFERQTFHTPSLAPDKSVLHSRQIAAVWNASSTKLKLSKNRVKSLYSLVKFQEGLVKFIEFYKFTKFRPDPNLWWTVRGAAKPAQRLGVKKRRRNREHSAVFINCHAEHSVH